MDRTNRGALFETMKPTRALAVMAVPIFMDPLLRLLGASENTHTYGRQHLMAAVVVGGVPTMLSNVVTLVCFILMFRRARDRTPLVLPNKIEKIGPENKRSLYSAGIPAVIVIFLFDLVTIVINRLVVAHGDIPLAAMGIELKLARLAILAFSCACVALFWVFARPLRKQRSLEDFCRRFYSIDPIPRFT